MFSFPLEALGCQSFERKIFGSLGTLDSKKLRMGIREKVQLELLDIREMGDVGRFSIDLAIRENDGAFSNAKDSLVEDARKTSCLEELRKSGVPVSIIQKQVRYLEGEEAVEANWGPPQTWQRYFPNKCNRHLWNGGWIAYTFDPVSGTISDWGQFKPNKPNRAKYVTPARKPYQLLVCAITWELGLQIAARAGCDAAYRQRIPAGQDLTETDKYFYHWARETDIPLHITEGIKKAGCLIGMGLLAVAVPGITMWSQKKVGFNEKRRLNPTLQWLLGKEPRKIVIAFDSDTKTKTKKNTLQQAARLEQAILDHNSQYTISLPRWNPEDGKGVDDVWASKGADFLLTTLSQGDSPAEVWKEFQPEWRRYEWQIDGAKLVDQRYLNVDFGPSRVVCIKSPTGTGKSKLFMRYLKKHPSEKILSITYRVLLGEIQSKVLNLRWFRDNGTEERMCITIDSLHPDSMAEFDWTRFKDHTVFLDEVTHILEHLNNSPTCKHARESIKNSFRKLLRNCKRVIAMSANLKQGDLDALSTLTKEVPYVIHNTYIESKNQRTYHFYESKNDVLRKIFGDRRKHGEGFRQLILTDSIKAESKDGITSHALECMIKTLFPEVRVLRIDSSTTRDPNHPAHLARTVPNEVLKKHDVVIASPCIETGVSIDLKGHFDRQYGLFLGTTSVDGIRQLLSRLREPVETDIWARKCGMPGPHGFETDKKKILEQLDRQVQREFEGTGKFYLSRDHEDWQRPLYAEQMARGNKGLRNLQEELALDLRAEGQIVQFQKGKYENSFFSTGELSKVVKENYQRVRERRSKEVSQSKVISLQQAIDRSKKQNLSLQEQLECQRAFIDEKFGCQEKVTPDHVKLDSEITDQQISLLLYTTLGLGYAIDRDRELYKSYGEKLTSFVVFREGISSTVKFLCDELIPIISMMERDPERYWYWEDPELKPKLLALKAKALEYRERTFSPHYAPMQVLGLCLRMIGRRLQKVEKRTFDKVQRHCYKIAPLEPLLAESLKRRIKILKRQYQLKQEQKDLERELEQEKNSELYKLTNNAMNELGWSQEDCSNYLQTAFGKANRWQLSEEEFWEFSFHLDDERKRILNSS